MLRQKRGLADVLALITGIVGNVAQGNAMQRDDRRERTRQDEALRYAREQNERQYADRERAAQAAAVGSIGEDYDPETRARVNRAAAEIATGQAQLGAQDAPERGPTFSTAPGQQATGPVPIIPRTYSIGGLTQGGRSQADYARDEAVKLMRQKAAFEGGLKLIDEEAMSRVNPSQYGPARQGYIEGRPDVQQGLRAPVPAPGVPGGAVAQTLSLIDRARLNNPTLAEEKAKEARALEDTRIAGRKELALQRANAAADALKLKIGSAERLAFVREHNRTFLNVIAERGDPAYADQVATQEAQSAFRAATRSPGQEVLAAPDPVLKPLPTFETRKMAQTKIGLQNANTARDRAETYSARVENQNQNDDRRTQATVDNSVSLVGYRNAMAAIGRERNRIREREASAKATMGGKWTGAQNAVIEKAKREANAASTDYGRYVKQQAASSKAVDGVKPADRKDEDWDQFDPVAAKTALDAVPATMKDPKTGKFIRNPIFNNKTFQRQKRAVELWDRAYGANERYGATVDGLAEGFVPSVTVKPGGGVPVLPTAGPAGAMGGGAVRRPQGWGRTQEDTFRGVVGKLKRPPTPAEKQEIIDAIARGG